MKLITYNYFVFTQLYRNKYGFGVEMLKLFKMNDIHHWQKAKDIALRTSDS